MMLYSLNHSFPVIVIVPDLLHLIQTIMHASFSGFLYIGK